MDQGFPDPRAVDLLCEIKAQTSDISLISEILKKKSMTTSLEK